MSLSFYFALEQSLNGVCFLYCFCTVFILRKFMYSLKVSMGSLSLQLQSNLISLSLQLQSNLII